MQGKATLAGHPIHPILITFPIGCFVASVISDIIFLASGSSFWGAMSMWLAGFGVVGGLLAAFSGFVDYLSAPMSTQARTVANWHATLNLGVVILFAVAFAVRYFDQASTWGHVATLIGFCLLLVSGVLGGQLAHRYLVGSSEEDLGMQRTALDENAAMSPTERIARDRERAGVTKGKI